MKGFLKFTGWLVVAMVVFAGLLIWHLDGNDLREPLAKFASDRLEREVTIGELQVDIGWVPRIRIQHLRIANPPWSDEPYMAEVDAASARVPVWSLLRGKPVFREIIIDRPVVRLVRNAEGQVNWDFAEDDESAGEPPSIQTLVINDGSLHYRDIAEDTAIGGRFFTAGNRTHWHTDGRFRGAPLRALARTGELPAVLAARQPFPIEAEVWYAAQYASASGEITDPEDFSAFHFDLYAEGDELSTVLDLFGMPVPEMNAFELGGRLTRTADRWRVEELNGHLGETRLQAGELAIDGGTGPVLVEGSLDFAHLNIKELLEFFGSDETGGKDRSGLFPDTPIPVGWLDAFDVRLKLRAGDGAFGAIEGRDIEVDLILEDGTLRADPLVIDVARGRIEGEFQLEAPEEQPSFTADMRFNGVALEEVLQFTKVPEFVRGRLFGHIELQGSGRSVAELVGRSDGQVGLILTGGAIDQSLAEGIALNILEMLFGDGEPDQELRCAAAGFDVNSGTMDTEVLVFDTEERVIFGDGTIDLQQERIKLKLQTKAKEAGRLAAQAPVIIEGPLDNPEVEIDESELALRGGAAIVLGALATPLASAFAFIEPGEGEDQNCRALIKEVQQLG